MDRRAFLTASGIGVTAALAGCLGGETDDDEKSDPGAQATGSAANGPEKKITVSASSEVETEPDKAVLSIGIEAEGADGQEVRDELASGAEQLRETFDELGIPDDNIEEGRYRIHPAHGDRDGMQGTHTFDVTLDEIDRVGEVIDASVAAGADNIGRVNFTIQEETRDELREDALDAALANADEEAEHVADNRGVEISGTTAVTTNDVRVHASRYNVVTTAADGSDDAAAPSTSIDTDPVSVSASVTVVYTFE